jgi:hypothetical protein
MDKESVSSSAVICRNCGHERRFDEDAPLWKCPKCDMAYNKTSTNTVKDQSSEEKPRKFMANHSIVLIVGIVLGVVVGFGLSEVRNSANPPAADAATSNSLSTAKKTSREGLIPESRDTGVVPTDGICNRKFLEELDNNENLTKLQKDSRVVETCAGRPVRLKGRVTRADFQTAFEIKDSEGVTWGLSLVAGHNCGNLLYLTIGQEVAVTGVIKDGYAHLIRFYLENANCTTN